MKLSKAQLKALNKISKEPDFIHDGRVAPSLMKRGLIRVAVIISYPMATGVMGFYKFEITPAGRSALEEGERG